MSTHVKLRCPRCEKEFAQVESASPGRSRFLLQSTRMTVQGSPSSGPQDCPLCSRTGNTVQLVEVKDSK